MLKNNHIFQGFQVGKNERPKKLSLNKQQFFFKKWILSAKDKIVCATDKPNFFRESSQHEY